MQKFTKLLRLRAHCVWGRGRGRLLQPVSSWQSDAGWSEPPGAGSWHLLVHSLKLTQAKQTAVTDGIRLPVAWMSESVGGPGRRCRCAWFNCHRLLCLGRESSWRPGPVCVFPLRSFCLQLYSFSSICREKLKTGLKSIRPSHNRKHKTGLPVRRAADSLTKHSR